MKPSYSFFKNTGYALMGIGQMLKTEKSFQIEFTMFFADILFLLFLVTQGLSIFLALLSLSSFLLILLAESLNSAIEAVVDMVSQEYHELAKKAKDCGSAGVFFAISITATIHFAAILSILSWRQ